MRKRSNHCIILFGLWIIILFFRVGYSQKFPFRTYTQKNGLASAVVNVISQNRDGFLWIGTNNGLSRFNGVQFTNLKREDGLSGNWISCLYEDSKGNLWIGTDPDGVTCISGENYTHYSTNEGLAHNRVFAITEDTAGGMWFATAGGLCYLNGKDFQTFDVNDGLPSNFITCLTFDHQFRLWIGTREGIVLRDKDSFINPFPSGQFSKIRIRAIIEENPDKIWIGTDNGLYLSQTDSIVKFTTQKGLCNNRVNCLMKDSEGNLWIGTGEGVSLLMDGKFTTFTVKNGLPNNIIFSLFQDTEGNIWIGTENGVSRISKLNVRLYTEEEGLPDSLTITIIEDKKNHIWTGTSRGISCFDGHRFVNYTEKDGLIYNFIHQLLEDEVGNIWIAATNGISVLNTETGKFINYDEKDGLPGKFIFRIYQTSDNRIWVGGQQGLRVYQNERFSTPSFISSSSNLITVTAILEDNQRALWFSAKNRLLYYKDQSLITVSKERYPEGFILNLFQDSIGRIWIAAQGGLGCLDKGVYKSYSQHDGLPDNFCYFVIEDDNHLLWVGTANGLAIFDGQKFTPFTVPELNLSTGNWTAGLLDHKHRLWFGSTEGLTVISRPYIKRNVIPPPIYSTGVKVLERDLPLTQRALLLNLNHKENYIRFNYTGLNFTEPERVVYRYRLEGLDDTWHKTSDRSVFYPYLPPGKYSFQVTAVNKDGIESTHKAEIPFRIHPPFWRTWWFCTLAFFVAIGLAGAFFHWRLAHNREKEKLEAQEKELEANKRQLVMAQRMELMGTLATGTVHDLKNLLSIIIGYSRRMKSKVADDDKSLSNIEMIKNTAETATQMVRQILSFSRFNHDTPKHIDLGISLSETLQTLAVSKPKHVRVHWAPPTEPILFTIHPAHFQQIVMNLCLNALQAMPGGGELKVNLKKDEIGIITLQIEDTGIGMEEEAMKHIFEPLFTTKKADAGTGLGLFVSKHIIEEHQGKIFVASTPGKGSIFTVTFS